MEIGFEKNKDAFKHENQEVDLHLTSWKKEEKQPMTGRN